MRDYEGLVKRLKKCAELHGECSLCVYQGNPCDCMPETPLEEAADAIEDLIFFANGKQRGRCEQKTQVDQLGGTAAGDRPESIGGWKV